MLVLYGWILSETKNCPSVINESGNIHITSSDSWFFNQLTTFNSQNSLLHFWLLEYILIALLPHDMLIIVLKLKILAITNCCKAWQNIFIFMLVIMLIQTQEEQNLINIIQCAFKICVKLWETCTVGLQNNCSNLRIHYRGGGRFWSYFRGRNRPIYMA